jgi:tRNA (guanine-N7-)-methyltransferase
MDKIEHPRTVRSFIRRNGRLTHGQQQALNEAWSRYGIEFNGFLDLSALFQNQNPCWLEIGFGMGDNLLHRAAQNLNHNHLGIDVHLPGIGRLLHHIKEQQLNNLRIVNGDASQWLSHLPDACLAGVYLLFPDPWPKKKHHKRRIVQPPFVQLLRQKLQPCGVFHLATDWQAYAQHMLTVMENEEGWRNLAGQGQYSPRPARPLTKFEQRGLRLGHGIWDLCYQKDDDCNSTVATT